ncbi:MAG: hypothetical protein IJ196_03725 [Prevotella sp.]|nr:hypothetical protein [Prevotella sp.]
MSPPKEFPYFGRGKSLKMQAGVLKSLAGCLPDGCLSSGRRLRGERAKDDVLPGKTSSFGRQYIIFCPVKAFCCGRHEAGMTFFSDKEVQKLCA